MTDIGQIGLDTLSTSDLRRLLVILRRSGRTEAARLVLLELERRDAIHGGSPAPSVQPFRRRKAVAAGVGAAAVIAISAAVLTPVISRLGDQAPEERNTEVAATPNRAMVALGRPEAPAVSRPRIVERDVERDVEDAPARTATAPRDLAIAPVGPRVTAEPRPPQALAALPTRPEPEPPAASDQAATGEAVLAVSQAPALLAASCGSADGAARMVCDDARRVALNDRQARGAPVPVRVAIAPAGGARSLASPTMGRGAPR